MKPVLKLGRVVAECVERLPADVGRRVIVDVPGAVEVRADARALEMVLSTLISNAIRFSPETSPIRITAVPEDRVVVLNIRDSGPGIPAADRESIFDASHPAGGSRLALVSSYVEMQGGRVWVERAPEGGAAFSFTLPRAGAAGRPGSPRAEPAAYSPSGR
jgi:signal transduction histidine kinase